MDFKVCVPKSLNSTQSALALRRSIEINPENAAETKVIERTPTGRRGGPRRLVLLIGSRWPKSCKELSVQFLDNASKTLRSKILLYMNLWSKTVNISFRETDGLGDVRIARLDHPVDLAGYWSYVGTQARGIEDDQPTLNLDGFTMRTSDSEFKRVVCHEAGHALGFDHEHMRTELVKKINRTKAFAYFDKECGWSKQETIEQVLTPLAKKSVIGTTEADPTSIMCYEIPAKITIDGKRIVGGDHINSKDFAFAGTIYPKSSSSRTEGRRAPLTDAVPEEVATAEKLFPQESDTLHLVILDDFKPTQNGKAGNKNSHSDEQRPRFARIFASYGGARVTGAMRLRATSSEPPTSYGKIIRMHERIKSYTNRERGELPSDDELVQFGTDLFETLFQGDVRRLYDEARARQQNRKLDFVLTSMIPWIAEKPWEFAYDPGRQSFLATEEIHLVRNVLTAVPPSAAPLMRGPLRILIASAQPVGMGRLSIEQEVEVIRRGFEPLIDSNLVSVEVMARATPGILLGRLSTGTFNVLHVIGHGQFQRELEEGAIIFEDDRGGEFPLGVRSIREICCKRGISMVFLNSCQSGSGGRHNFNKGVAQALVSHGVPAVVANQYSVLDSSATSFAQHFYWALANGMSIGQSACEARIAVNCSLNGEIIDWAVPVVYARDPNMALCAKPTHVVPMASTAVRAESHRTIRSRRIRVAVWDLDSVFPSLNDTLKKMNDAQTVFGFELVALSAPIDAWDVDQRAEDGTPYLWAEKLASRLQHLTVELGVNVLACITGHWMRDDNYLNIYGWWPTDQNPPVLIFSSAGFDELAPAGDDTDRAIANLMVEGLTGFLSNVDAHSDKIASNCPLAFNESRSLAHVIGRQEFHAGCVKKLKRKIPHELASLRALLKKFH